MLVIGGVGTSDLCARAYVAERDAHLVRTNNLLKIYQNPYM